MKIPVFLSYPKPFLAKQEDFLKKTFKYLDNRGLAARTLGVTDYDMDAPLKAVRRILLESNGLITIAFRRTLITSGITRPETDIADLEEQEIKDVWLTSPWAQIEGAMAYQLGLPILIFREKGVIADGILEKGVTGLYMPEFDVDETDKYFKSIGWSEVVGKWEGYVRAVLDKRGNPPQLY